MRLRLTLDGEGRGETTRKRNAAGSEGGKRLSTIRKKGKPTPAVRRRKWAARGGNEVAFEKKRSLSFTKGSINVHRRQRVKKKLFSREASSRGGKR